MIVRPDDPPPLEVAALVSPVVAAYGGGTNSTAMLVGWVRKKYAPVDLILFADTGGERPETYDFIDKFSRWLVAEGLPSISVIRKGGLQETLEQKCLRNKSLPSIAYGFKTCSHAFKIEPQEREVNRYEPARQAWRVGLRVTKLVGYGREEQRRIARAGDGTPKYWLRFPLDVWGWDRDDCVEMIRKAGLPQPGKSSCFFCPASKKTEILDLYRRHPGLFERAVALEHAAKGTSTAVKGLGRRFSWDDFVAGAASVPESGIEGCVSCADDGEP